MICPNDNPFFQWTTQVPISFTEWKCILSNISTKEAAKLSSSDPHTRSTSQVGKAERQPLPRNQVFGDTVVDSFLASSSAGLCQSSVAVTRQDIPKVISSPNKRYVSSFKTLVSSTNGKHTQKLNQLNDGVMILKLPKEQTNNVSTTGSPLSSKHSTLSMATTTTATIMSNKTPSSQLQQQQQQQQQQQNFSPSRLSPILKVEGQRRRTVHHDASLVISSATADLSVGSHPTNQMAMSTGSQPQANSSVFTYRSAAAGGNTIRQRAIAETTTTSSLVISTERFKPTFSTTVRTARQLLPPPVTLSSTYTTAQPVQRNMNQNAKPRLQQEKLMNPRDFYDYPDPFTNCPQDILNKLAQLTRLQMETIEWERKKRFAKKKPIANGAFPVKDSP